MKTYPYTVVDVFTRVPLEGNALAVFPDSRGIGESVMQKIARELNLSETVFIQDSAAPGCVKRLRIFTPGREMNFAGHPTIGAAFVMLLKGMLTDAASAFAVEENIGPVAIHVEKTEPAMMWLQTPRVAFERTFDPTQCARLIRLHQDQLLHVEPCLVNAGNPTLLIALSSRDAVDRASLDSEVFATLRQMMLNPFCVFVFTPTPEGAYSRMFAPDYGIAEDPATGSSTGPLAAYMRQHQLLSRGGMGRFLSEQGTRMGRRSLLYFDITGDRILVGGYVTPVIEATLTL